MCQHDFKGRRVFQHRNMDKWDYLLMNRKVYDFWFEQECRDYIVRLRKIWDGGCKKLRKTFPRASVSVKDSKSASVLAVIVTYSGRKHFGEKTLQNLRQTDWGDRPAHLQIHKDNDTDDTERHTRRAFLALKKGFELETDFIVLLEDDLEFNYHIGFNLDAWAPLRSGEVTIANLYNFRGRELAFDAARHARIIDPKSWCGSQAYLFSRDTVRYLLRRWKDLEGSFEVKVWRLAQRLRNPIYFYAPSLVQRADISGDRGKKIHKTADFDADWVHPNRRRV
jgi:hypothetical protein